ncbi:MAG: HNH endonuclease signature motif containing protein [Planctomycetota bacterium]
MSTPQHDGNLTPDSQILLDEFKTASRRFREGKAERTGVIRFYLQPRLDWTDRRFNDALAALKQMGQVKSTSEGIQLGDGIPKQRTMRLGVKLKPESRCAYCGCLLKQGNTTVDHVIPKYQGGDDSPANLVLACRRCNNVKGPRTPEQWALDILRYRHPVKRRPSWPKQLATQISVWVCLVLTWLKGGV